MHTITTDTDAKVVCIIPFYSSQFRALRKSKMIIIKANLLPYSIHQRFSTCGPRPTGGPRTSAWWAATKVENWEIFWLESRVI